MQRVFVCCGRPRSEKIPQTDDLSNSENRVTIGIKFLTTKVCAEDGIRNMWIPLDLGNRILLPV